ncbi:MAG TPA: hypothetical protein VD971_06110 [Phycisphaerales bacterium]|nr:hypothetical protein [Phycisphaerales bacterium]
MSAKGRRSNAWDDRHLKGPLLWPIKALLRALSSITLAVILLSFVALYGVSASVPVGLLALAPTYLLCGLTIVAAVALIAGPPAWGVLRALRHRPGPTRTVAVAGAFVLLTGVAVLLWHAAVWPVLRYDPISGEGVRLFAGFVKEYGATTIRRLPGMEMSELEYYAWWPLRVALLLFVANMVVATVRRIEFNFKNIGVLTVHTGIVVIALGSVYYSGLKVEGDTLLLAGQQDSKGVPTSGPPQELFYDNTRVSLFVSTGPAWEQRPLADIPRYNAYGLDQIGGTSAIATSGLRRPWEDGSPARDLSLPVEPLEGGVVDPDIALRVVGYAPYADAARDWVKLDAPAPDAEPLRIVYLHSSLPDAQGNVSDKPAFAFHLAPTTPADRLSIVRGDNGTPTLSLEYTSGMPGERWRDLSEHLPADTLHALVIEIPGSKFRGVYPVSPGLPLTLGNTGYRVTVRQLLNEPPFPIITEGYRGANSSVAVVTITTPSGETFDRYVYHRFPEINQDVAGTKEDGRPNRRDADPAIRVGLIDATHLGIYIDEPAPGMTRAIVREPGGGVRVIGDLAAVEGGPEGWLRDIVRGEHGGRSATVSLRIGERWDNAVRVTRPRPVPEARREKSAVGTHQHAMLAVEVTSAEHPGWRWVEWLPFQQYIGMGEAPAQVALPDGRRLSMSFGRLQHRFPGFAISLVDFQMLSYDHRGAPRDYQSVVRVLPVDAAFDAYEHVTRLNEPLGAPFMWNDDRPWIANALAQIQAGLSPNQFKLSQAGWDQQGWVQTQAQADAGILPRPFAKFTILGVGNRPGIHIIALGGVLMALGIPWAFYLKPYLVQRESKRLRDAAARGEIKPRSRTNVEVVAVPAAAEGER